MPAGASVGSAAPKTRFGGGGASAPKAPRHAAMPSTTVYAAHANILFIFVPCLEGGYLRGLRALCPARNCGLGFTAAPGRQGVAKVACQPVLRDPRHLRCFASEGWCGREESNFHGLPR